MQFIGSLLAAIGFSCLSFTFYLEGFIIGLLSCLFLVGYFKATGQYSLFFLQLFFSTANLIGIYNQIII